MNQIRCSKCGKRNAIVYCAKCKRALCNICTNEPCRCGCWERDIIDNAKVGAWAEQRELDAEQLEIEQA